MLKEMVCDSFSSDSSYKHFISEIKNKYQEAQIKAAQIVNRELILFYWQLGKDIIEKQKLMKWGSKFLEKLSEDMLSAFPETKGFSVRNLKFMRQFAELYPNTIGKQAVSQLPWGHIIVLMQRVKEEKARNWYIENTAKHGISRNVLMVQIEQDLYSRQGITESKISNFQNSLTPLHSDLATEMLKNPYNLDFLTIGKEAHERDLENALTNHISKFLRELGVGFAFMGNQYKIAVDNEDFYIDMLFYHTKLHCYVVVELKTTEFKPEYTGKLNFYLAAVDSILKTEKDNPTIGLLLCQSKSKIIAEYSLRNISSPIGISEYELIKKLPKKLKTSLPTIEEIEKELEKK